MQNTISVYFRYFQLKGCTEFYILIHLLKNFKEKAFNLQRIKTTVLQNELLFYFCKNKQMVQQALIQNHPISAKVQDLAPKALTAKPSRTGERPFEAVTIHNPNTATLFISASITL